MPRNQAILLGGYAGRMLVALGITAVVGRTDAETLAFFTLVGTVFFLLHLTFDLGTASVVAREIARNPSRERTLLEGLIGWRRLAGWLFALGLVGWALLEPDREKRVVLLVAALASPLLTPGALTPAFVVRQAQGGPETGRIVGHALVLAGSLAFKLAGVIGPLYGLLIVLRELVGALWLRALAGRLLGYRPRAGLRGKGLGAFFAMAWVPAAAAALQHLYFHLDVLLVLGMRGDAELGAYAAAFRPVNMLLVLPGLFMIPLLPVLTKAALGDRSRFAAHVRDASWLLLGVGALGGTVGALLARDFIAVLYGGRYLDGALDAVPALRWMSLAFALVFATAAPNAALLADGRERLLLLISAAGVVVNAAGNLLLLPFLGFTAAAFTTALTVLAVGAASAAALANAFGARGFAASRLLVLAPAAVAAAALSAVGGGAWSRIATGVLVAAGGMGALLTSPGSRSFRRALAAPPAGSGAGTGSS